MVQSRATGRPRPSTEVGEVVDEARGQSTKAPTSLAAGRSRGRGRRPQVQRGEIVAVVGESGSGSRRSALALLGLLRRRGRTGVGGKVSVLGAIWRRPGRRPTSASACAGARLGAVFQDPIGSLNPTMTSADSWRRSQRPWSARRGCSTPSACRRRSCGCGAIPTSCQEASDNG